MAVVMQVCPTCDGSGAGWAPIPGPTCAAGMCPDCLGGGEVTAEKRTRLLVRRLPMKTHGTGGAGCCDSHRRRCIFGHSHTWTTWFDNGQRVRTADTYKCESCGGVCVAEENDPSGPRPSLGRTRP